MSATLSSSLPNYPHFLHPWNRAAGRPHGAAHTRHPKQSAWTLPSPNFSAVHLPPPHSPHTWERSMSATWGSTPSSSAAIARRYQAALRMYSNLDSNSKPNVGVCERHTRWLQPKVRASKQGGGPYIPTSSPIPLTLAHSLASAARCVLPHPPNACPRPPPHCPSHCPFPQLPSPLQSPLPPHSPPSPLFTHTPNPTSNPAHLISQFLKA